jgi:hypothetical protein
MRLHQIALAVGFVAALVAVFYRIYFVPPIGWGEWALLTVGVSLVGGLIIGQRWAVGTAFAVNTTLSLLLLALVGVFHDVRPGAAFLSVQVLVSTGATASAVRLRSTRAAAVSTPT